jgi:hypothetical protein
MFGFTGIYFNKKNYKLPTATSLNPITYMYKYLFYSLYANGVFFNYTFVLSFPYKYLLKFVNGWCFCILLSNIFYFYVRYNHYIF